MGQELQFFRNNKSIIIRLTELPQPKKTTFIFWVFFFSNLLVKTVIISFSGSEPNDGVYDSCCIDGRETIDHRDNQGIFLAVVAAIQREKKNGFQTQSQNKY